MACVPQAKLRKPPRPAGPLAPTGGWWWGELYPPGSLSEDDRGGPGGPGRPWEQAGHSCASHHRGARPR